MISDDRPVTGTDLMDLRARFGLSVGDFLSLMGLSVPQWTRIRREMDEPVYDPAVALLARYLDANPNHPMIPRRPSAEDLYRRLDGLLDGGLSKKEFGLALGREASGGYRWLVQGGKMPPVLLQILEALEIDVSEQGAGAWQEWRATAEREAAARGIGDIWKEGQWKGIGDGSDDL